jgi:sulfite exporter TauE/SafE
MALYGAGTLPVLLVFGLGAGRLGPVLRQRLQGLGAVLVLAVGLQLILRAAAAWGWIGHARIGSVVFW